MLQYIFDNLKEEDVVDSLPSNRDCIERLMGLSENETFQMLRDSIGRTYFLEEVFCEHIENGKWTFRPEYFCPNETSECLANLERAITNWSKANTILPLTISFGSLFETYASMALGSSFDSGLFGRWVRCGNLGKEEELMHQYLESLTERMGLGGNVSLFDLPTILAPQV